MSASLGDVCTFLNGGTPSRNISRYFKGDIPWITGADILSPVVESARSFITEEAIENSATNRVPAGTVLLVTRTSVGKVAIAGNELCFSQDITALKPDLQKVDTAYLVQFIRTQEPYFERLARGATIKGVTREVLERLKIPLPPLAEQRRIAAILDHAEALRAKRRAALAQLDALTQSLFLEIFGDPVANPKGWTRVPMSEILDRIESGWSPVCLDRPADSNEWGVLKLGAVTWCEFDDSQQKALPANLSPRPELEVQRGDLLLTRKNTYDLVAACALVRQTRSKLMISDLVFRLRLKPQVPVIAEFLHRLLITPSKRRQIQKLAGGSAGSMPNISKTKLLTSAVELPPLPLQREFAAQVAAVERLKAAQKASLAKLDALFASLQHRAFRGEL